VVAIDETGNTIPTDDADIEDGSVASRTRSHKQLRTASGEGVNNI
jgi:hypothetical protein